MMKLVSAVLLAALALVAPAAAQTPALVKPCVQTSATSCPPVSATNPLPIVGASTGLGLVKIWDGTNTAAVKAANVTPTTSDPGLVVSLAPASNGLIATGTAGSPGAQVVTVQGTAGGTGLGSYSDFPVGATPIVAASGNVAAATATATLAAASGKTTYLTGFSVTGSGATAASVVSCTVSNLIGSVTWTFTITVPAGVTTAVADFSRQLVKPIPASATNTAIAVSCPSFGAGNTNATVFAQGYQL